MTILTENHNVSKDNIVEKKSTDSIVLSEDFNNVHHSFERFMRKACGQETDPDPKLLMVGEMGSRATLKTL